MGSEMCIRDRATPARARASFLYIDGHVLSLSDDGGLTLIAADAAAYREVATMKLELGKPAWSAPVVSHGLLYVRGSEKLMCLELIGG